ncbi:MAG: FtsX-like permease family protein [Planctomycetia bacterium]|nr:FtsX-like permease family protein [Planctomycetia bacterium]
MYKLLLIWRYLLTRYIALVSVVSITLGVATMIVVNSVMLGFSNEMETRIHGVLSDVTISSRSSLRGFDDVDTRVNDVWHVAGDLIDAVTPTVNTPGLLSFEVLGGEIISTQVEIVGIDEMTNEKVTSISQFLQHPKNRDHLSFQLQEAGYDIRNPLFGEEATVRPTLRDAGWGHRRVVAKYEKFRAEEEQRQRAYLAQTPPMQSDYDPIVAEGAAEISPAANTPDAVTEKTSAVDPYEAALAHLPKMPAPDSDTGTEETGAAEETEDAEPDGPGEIPLSAMASPLDNYEEFQNKFDKETEQETGMIVGMGLVSGLRRRSIDPETGKECYREALTMMPGDDATLSFLAVGGDNALPSIVYDRFTVTDLYECRMSEYDMRFVFVPIAKLQELRKMIAPDGTRLATHLLIKAKPGVHIEELRDRLQNSELFPPQLYRVETWRDQQETMLAAVATELSILNVLLFLIIAVAGFGILAIFFMIVVEKTRDIGILKSLGAGGWGIMQIFLCYGLALGMVGAGLGLILGLTFVHNINAIARFLSYMMGHEVFDPTIYMFQQVPAIIDPLTVVAIMLGAIFIAVAAGVLPAIRAAKLNPVDALRV